MLTFGVCWLWQDLLLRCLWHRVIIQIKKMEGELWQTQIEMAEYIENHPRCCITTGMRGGKTRAALWGMRAEDTVLVICPASVKKVWDREAKELWGEETLNIQTIDTGLDYKHIKHREDERNIIICTPKLASSLAGRIWSAVIIDEIHKIKNANSIQFRVIRNITDNSDRVVGLSGTPATNRPKDLYALFRLMHHPLAYREGESYRRDKQEPRYFFFMNTFCYSGSITSPYTRKKIRQFNGCRNSGELVKAMEDFMFRGGQNKNKYEIIERVFPIRLSQEVRETYDRAYWDFVKSQKEKGILNPKIHLAKNAVEVLKMRQILSLYKAKIFMEAHQMTVNDGAEGNGKKVVFTAFQETKKMIRGHVPGSIIHESEDDVETWKKHPSRNFLLITSIRKGGVGLDLSDADTSHFIDIDWSPKENEQAKKRIEGARQKSNTIYRMYYLCPNTVDDLVMQTNKDKIHQLETKLKI